MTSDRQIDDSTTENRVEADTGGDDSGPSICGPTQSARSIADLDIETIQWLSDDLREGFALYDPDDRLVVANAEYIRLHQSVRDILKPGMTFETMIRAMVARGVVEVPAGGEEDFIASRVGQHRNPTGAIVRHLSDGGAYIIKETRLSDGSIISRENDISEIVAAREALRKSEERFKALAEIASDWFWETDEHHRVKSVTFPERFGFGSVEDVIGKTCWEMIGADPVNDPHWARHKADLDAHRPFKGFVYSYVPPTGMSTHFRVSGSAVFNESGLAIGYRSMPSDDGGRRHFSVSGVPVFDSFGEFQGYRGTSREVTNEILSERRAAAAHQRLLDAIEALPESLVLFDADDRIVLCNSATYTRLPWCKTLLEPGMKYEDALREIAYTGAAGVRGREEEWIRDNLERHRAASGKREYRRNDGRWVRITERRTADGGVVVIRADITEEKQAELELEAALMQAREENRAKSTFLANLTHELRLPLSRIAHLTNELTESASGTLGDAQRDIAKAIGEVAVQTQRMLGDVLDLSRIQVGRHTLTPTDIDVAALVNDCCAIANGDRKRPKIVAEIAPDLGVVHVDEPTMRHMLLNVLGDVLSGRAASGKVRIAAATVKDRVEIAIHDEHATLGETDLEFLMRPFRDVDGDPPPALRPQAKGFGIGLAVAGALAREIGAILSISAPPEGGFRVAVTLPRTQA